MKHFILVALISIALFACKHNEEKKNTNTSANADTSKTKVVDFIFKKDSVLENGESIKRYKNGVIEMQGTMKNGKREGLWKSFYENGSKWSETTFAGGKKNGKTITWFPNEQKRYEGYYTNDIESGSWTFWNDKGKEVSKKNYENK